ncbi:protein LATERAL ORGAN BOUNDARIES-like [Humulus lupulus]|uniref:protein LATERAL ORGAN BOUNDARIES-like n=1 Tax=Humulus lupulus TaxID=3486 RepID=UPI002B40D3C5|nr:protein LATERAL ORGAN BOUNDARIES-like [Humulus lupulus]XP_062116174.1 protein LATERAL ORGAN BOUNDARIES-like [Humulus lupulus]
MASSSSYNSPCAACKFLRRKCMPGCIFAPYFPPEEPQKFSNVHKIFGASNVTKLLNELPSHQREDAVNSLAYEAEARVRDPVYGCVGAISFLQRQVQRLQKELDAANADLIRFACSEIPPPSDHHLAPPPPLLHHSMMAPPRQGGGGGDQFYHQPTGGGGGGFSLPYTSSLSWSDNPSGNINEGEGGEGHL